MESMKESARQPEGQQESKGILGTIRDYLTPEFSETEKSEFSQFTTLTTDKDMWHCWNANKYFVTML